MPDKSLWQSLMDAIPSRTKPTSVADVLGTLPELNPAQTFSEDIARRKQAQMFQAQTHRQALADDSVGLQPALGPMGVMPSVATMQGLAVSPELAVGLGQDLGNAAKAVDPKAFGIAFMGLPLLLANATLGKSAKPQLSREQLNAQLERIAPQIDQYQAYADKIGRQFSVEPAVDWEAIANHIANVPDQDLLKPTVFTLIRNRLMNDHQKQYGKRGQIGTLSEAVESRLQATEQVKYQSPYDLVVEQPESWKQFDLSDAHNAKNFRQDIITELQRTGKSYHKTLSSITQQVSEEMMTELLSARNARLVKAGKSAEAVVHFRMRDKLRDMLDKYFMESAKPRTIRASVVPSQSQESFVPKTPNAKAMIAKEAIPYKSDVILASATAKMATNQIPKLSSEELMALLDNGLYRTALKVHQRVQSKNPRPSN